MIDEPKRSFDLIQTWEIKADGITIQLPVYCQKEFPMRADKFGDCWEVVNHALQHSPQPFNPATIQEIKIVSEMSL